MERDDVFQEDEANRSPLALDQDTLLNDKFRVGRVLGVGGFGITYLAFDEVLEMVVAVKEYLPNDIAVRKTDGDTVQPLSSAVGEQDFEYGLESFLQEARTLAKFERHPNIVRVRTFFQENGTAYLVMNFYKGRTLAEYLEARNGFIPEEEALLIMEQVVDGLGAVHEEDILHRDIDPNNVYLADDGTVVLLDFGAARTAVGERTQSMSVVLKRGYAPHEQYHSHGDQGPWTDIYACSATLYRALTGYKPPEAAARILEDDLAPPKELVPSLSDPTNDAVVKGLAIRPQNRPQSMDDFAELLPRPPDDAQAGWIGELSTMEREQQAAVGAAEVQVTSTHPCRLYVDGSQVATLPPEESFTIGVDPGSHRLRAVRTDQATSGNATVTASGTDVNEGGRDARMSLDSLIWQDVVSASVDEVTTVEIDFESDSDARPPTEQPSETVQTEEPVPAAEESAPTSAAETQGGAGDVDGPDGGAPTEDAVAVNGEAAAADDDVPDTGEDEEAPAGIEGEVDRPVRVLVDGEEEMELESAEAFEVELAPGRYGISIEAADGPEKWSDTVVLEAGQTQTLDVDLQDAQESDEQRGALRYVVRGVLVFLLLFGGAWWALTYEPVQTVVDPVVEAVGPELQQVATAGQEWTFDRLGEWGIRNQVPKPRPDRVVATSDRVVVNVVANDRDPNGTDLRVRSAGPLPDSVGEITVEDSSHISVEPAGTFAGIAEIPYVVVDAPGDTAHSRITLRVPFNGVGQTVTDGLEQPQVVHTDIFRSNGGRDVVVAALGNESVSWTRNVPSDSGRFHVSTPLDTEIDGAVDVHSGDLTGNGRADLLSASLRSDAVTWYRNEGNGSFGPPQRLDTQADGAVAVRAVDVDGDGDNDAVAGALLNEVLLWYENEGDGQFSDPRTVTDDIPGLQALHISDLDQDSIPDLLAVSFKDSTIARYEPENREGEGDLFVEHPPITTGLRDPIEVHSADVTGNGQPDILAAKADEESLVLLANETDSTATTLQFEDPRVLSGDLRTIESVDTGDLDGDGDLDIVAASFDDDRVVWFENEGEGHFTSAQPIATEIQDVLSVHVTDLDGDGDEDVLVASQAENVVRWYENHLP